VEEIVYLNGSLLPLSQARLSSLDSGFLYGCGLFETMYAQDGRVFRLDRHMARLRRSASFLGISLDSLPELEGAVYECLEANRLPQARIRLTLSAGETRTIPQLTSHPSPTLLITATGSGIYPPEAYHRGFRAIVSRVRRNTMSPAASMKSLSCLDLLLARREARLAGVDEALLLNEKGLVAEGGVSNIFLVSDGRLLTPGNDSGILPGITRETVLEIASALGMAAAERSIGLDEVLAAEEAFFTNSLMHVMPLTEVNGQPIGSGRPGEVTRRLSSAYQKLMAEELSA